MSQNLTIGYIVLAFALAIFGGGLGASLARSHRRLCLLISIGAGTLLGVTVFDILPESIEALSWWGLLLTFGSGYFVFAMITKYVFHVCPACAASHFDEATAHRFSEIAAGMMIALAIHCTADGLAIAAGHESELAHAPGGRSLALSLVVAVCVHKVPEGLALGSLLLGAGFPPRSALIRVAAVESTTIIGGLGGLLFFKHISEVWLVAVVAHAGGGFLFLAFHAIFGEIFKDHKRLVIGGFTAGFVLIGALTLISRKL